MRSYLPPQKNTGGWQVLAMDRLPRAGERVRRLAKRHGVEDRIRTEVATIRKHEVTSSSGTPAFHESTYSLVCCIRFLERDFFPSLVRMVCEGGFFLFVSFIDIGVVFESPKDPKRLLKPGELAGVVNSSALGFEVVVDRVDQLPDGRFVNSFLAKRLLLPKENSQETQKHSAANAPAPKTNSPGHRPDHSM